MSRRHVTVGILAHDEASIIGRTIESLAAQSVFDGQAPGLPDTDWEVLVVPNGCSDDTEAAARRALERAAEQRPSLRWRVVSLARAGKSRAWNELVHSIASPHTDVFVMMDADIEFGHGQTIEQCVRRLVQDGACWAVVDSPLKDFGRKADPTWLERLSLRVSGRRLSEERPAISGQFYVVSAARLRSIWMPPDLSVEDGFLQAMVATDNFRQPPDYSRIVREPGATHYYEGLTRPADILRHEVRLMVGTVLNAFLCWDVLLFTTPRNGPGAGALIRELNGQDPDWYRRMMANQVGIRGHWVIGRNLLWRRLPGWWAMPLLRRLARLPYMAVVLAFDLLVAWRANRLLVSGRAVGYW